MGDLLDNQHVSFDIFTYHNINQSGCDKKDRYSVHVARTRNLFEPVEHEPKRRNAGGC